MPPKKKPAPKKAEADLSDFTFCLSGKFDKTRDEYTKLIKAAG